MNTETDTLLLLRLVLQLRLLLNSADWILLTGLHWVCDPHQQHVHWLYCVERPFVRFHDDCSKGIGGRCSVLRLLYSYMVEKEKLEVGETPRRYRERPWRTTFPGNDSRFCDGSKGRNRILDRVVVTEFWNVDIATECCGR